MPFYAFSLVKLICGNQRGKLTDVDLLTFSVFVNQVLRSNGATSIPMPTGSTTPLVAAPPGTRNFMSVQWTAGPYQLDPSDGISLVYTCHNTSDSQLTDIDNQQLEIKVLDAIYTGVIGAAGLGAIASAVSTVVGFIGDPIGKLLGWSPQGPCNGLIFSDTVQLTGHGVAALAFGPRDNDLGINNPGLLAIFENATEFQFTRPYTDEATHNTSTCGEVAHYSLVFAAIQVPYVSVKLLAKYLYYSDKDLTKGLKQLGSGKLPMSLKSTLHLRP